MKAVLSFALLLVAGSYAAQDTNPCASTGQSPYDYKQALCMSILFYEAQRSGYLPDDMRIDWRGDSATGDGSDNGVDLTGGYYDAGDHVKFGFPMAYTVTVLSWGLITHKSAYEAAGQVGYAQDAIRWGTDYFVKAHSSNSLLWGQVGDGYSDHAFWGRPEDMTMYRPSWKIDSGSPGSDLAGETAAALAAASIALDDSSLISHAEDLYNFAKNNRQLYHNSITNAADFYRSWSGYGDELAWAAVWLHKATGDSQYESDARGFWNEFGIGDGTDRFDWDGKFAGCMILFAEEFGDSTYRDAAASFMSQTRSGQFTPGGMRYIDQWGSLRHAINVAFIAFQAARIGIDSSANENFGAQQVNYALGSVGHSYMVGFGNNPPEKPHHRGSSCPDMPEYCDGNNAQYQGGPNPQTLFGALVGGPDANDYYVDDRNDYVKNEVACDYNAALTGALAAMVSLNS